MVCETRLHLSLAEHVNAEITLGQLDHLEKALMWMKMSYLWVRLKRNPAHYGLKNNPTEDQIELWLKGNMDTPQK